MTPQETTQKIQEIITQYQSLGWTDVRPLDMGGARLPRIVAWSEDDKFGIHIELHQATGNVHFTNIFTTGDNGVVAGYWFRGHHLTPAEVQAIIRLVKGEVVEIKAEAVDVRLEQLLEVESN